MRTTGPDVYVNGLWRAAKAANCTNRIQRVAPGECASTPDPFFARTYVCADDPVEGGMPLLHCQASRHYDCRKLSSSGRKCTTSHWQQGWRWQRRGREGPSYFFDLTVYK